MISVTPLEYRRYVSALNFISAWLKVIMKKWGFTEVSNKAIGLMYKGVTLALNTTKVPTFSRHRPIFIGT